MQMEFPFAAMYIPGEIIRANRLAAIKASFESYFANENFEERLSEWFGGVYRSGNMFINLFGQMEFKGSEYWY